MPYFMKCTICHEQFDNKTSWLKHLLSRTHQVPARNQFKYWNENERASVVVVYSDQSVFLVGVLLNFSCYEGIIVTDFVWHPHMPNIGFMQFESRSSVDDFLKRKGLLKSTGMMMKHINQKLQVRKASDYLDLEWAELFVNVKPDGNFKDLATNPPPSASSTIAPVGPIVIDISDDDDDPAVVANNLARKERLEKRNEKKASRESNRCYVPPKKKSEPTKISAATTSSKNPSTSQARNIFAPPPREPLPSLDALLPFPIYTLGLPMSAPTPPPLLTQPPVNPIRVLRKEMMKQPRVSTSSSSPPNPGNVLVQNTSSSSAPTASQGKPPSVLEMRQKRFQGLAEYNAAIALRTGSTSSTSKSDENKSSRQKEVPGRQESSSQAKKPRLEVLPTVRCDAGRADPRIRSLPLPVPPPTGLSLGPFPTQMKLIYDAVELPLYGWQNIDSLIKKLLTLFTPTFPKMKIYLFRNYYLQVRTNGSCDVVLYMDHGRVRINPELKIEELVYASDAILSQTDPELLLSLEGQIAFPQLARVNDETKAHLDMEKHSNCYWLPEQGLYFSLVADKSFLIERQACEMVKYLLTFDPRAKPALSVIIYWTKVNNIRVSNSLYKGYDIAPEPAALEWLVIFFLARNNIIPRVCTVLNQKRTPIIGSSPVEDIFVSYDGGVRDISFCPDPEIAITSAAQACKKNNWKDEADFQLSVLQLVLQFFEFCLTLKEKPCILNTQDCILILKEHVLDEERSLNKLMIDACLSRSEIAWLRQPMFRQVHLQLMYPFCPLRYSFSFDEKTFLGKTCEIMSACARRMKVFLGGYQQCPSNYMNYDIKDLFKP